MGCSPNSEVFLCLGLILGSVVFAQASGGEGSKEKLNYNRNGGDWPGLCSVPGGKQSPIDIIPAHFEQMDPAALPQIRRLGIVGGAHAFVTKKLPHVELEWEKFVIPASATVAAAAKDGDIFAPLSGQLSEEELTRVAFEPAQFHFHTPSENALNGELFDGVIHIVNFVKAGESAKCDAIKAAGGLGCPIVVSVFMRVNDHDYSPLSRVRTRGIKGTGEKHGNRVGFFDIQSLLPRSGRFAMWEGSLTTFPCTEGVLWLQLLEPISVHSGQIAAFKENISLSHGEDCSAVINNVCLPPRVAFNNRVIQDMNGRVLRTGVAY